MATCTGDQYVQNIERTECIGNSLVKINNNFKALDVAVCETGNDISDLVLLINQLSAANINLNNSIKSLSASVTYAPLSSILVPVDGNIASFGNVSAGEYSITYLSGSMKYIGAQNQPTYYDSTNTLTFSSLNVISSYNLSRVNTPHYFKHIGGPITLRLVDSHYTDNVGPGLTWTLNKKLN